MHIEYVESIDKSKRIFLFPTEPFSEKIKNENGKYLYASEETKSTQFIQYMTSKF